jgi:aldose 1-epimerase
MLMYWTDSRTGVPPQRNYRSHQIVDEATLRLSFEACCNQDTVINLCHHPYFNFSGQTSLAGHLLKIDADHYLPVSTDLIQTGKIASVAGSLFDFRSSRGVPEHKYNNTYALHQNQSGPLTRAASLYCGTISMELWTTQPSLHFYNAYMLKAGRSGHVGVPHPKYSGICLEPQAWPDSPNQSGFSTTVLRANTKYRQINEYRFQHSKNTQETGF